MSPNHAPGSVDHVHIADVIDLFLEGCQIAGTPDLIGELQAELTAAGVVEAVRRHDDDILFQWLMSAVSYQGISDVVAARYASTHGLATAHDIRLGLADHPSCRKLIGYWLFEDCRYHKGSQTCSQPDHIGNCPLPRHDLRNGRLNQTAYSLFLFFRDVARGDFVAWIDRQLELAASENSSSGNSLGQALLEPLGHVHGVANKVLSMALADLLLAASQDRPRWRGAGAEMIAIDSLVHNWLHRTGVLMKLDCEHPYGDKCYGSNGCAAVISAVADQLDATAFNPTYPKRFPRFIQRAIWWFCAQNGLGECNGNRVDDRYPCGRGDCPLFGLCEKRTLVRANR